MVNGGGGGGLLVMVTDRPAERALVFPAVSRVREVKRNVPLGRAGAVEGGRVVGGDVVGVGSPGIGSGIEVGRARGRRRDGVDDDLQRTGLVAGVVPALG